ncbi:MAG: hypothetical protein ACHQQS_03685 [Thermoanaerobaculales bacterium]
MASKRTLINLGVAVAVIALVVAIPVLAGGADKTASGDRYLIIAPHTAEQCLAALDEIKASTPKLLDKMDCGCMAGDHTGYVIVTAASEDEARNMLPANLRASAKVVKLNKFTAAQIASFHNKQYFSDPRKHVRPARVGARCMRSPRVSHRVSAG